MNKSARVAIRVAVIMAVLLPGAQAWAMHPMSWKFQDSPNPSSTKNVLHAVTMPNSVNAWAVGEYQNSDTTYSTLIAVYNGVTWGQQTSVNFVGQNNYLHGVKGTSASNIWAVGYHGLGTTFLQTLIEHYDGSTWSLQDSPNPSPNLNALLGVSAVSKTDAWAVGLKGKYGACDATTGDTSSLASLALNPAVIAGNVRPDATRPNLTTLIERWIGVGWITEKSPNPGGTEDVLTAVSASSATSVWAVGWYIPKGTCTRRTLIEHYDGVSWVKQSSPNAGGNNDLIGVSAVSDTNVWAVGEHYDRGILKTLVEHYDGTSWKVASLRSPGFDATLYGVKATSPTDVWAVGTYQTDYGQPLLPLIYRYNGTKWVRYSDGNPSYGFPLEGVAALSDTAAIAVGSIWLDPQGTTTKTLIKRCC